MVFFLIRTEWQGFKDLFIDKIKEEEGFLLKYTVDVIIFCTCYVGKRDLRGDKNKMVRN